MAEESEMMFGNLGILIIIISIFIICLIIAIKILGVLNT